MGRGMMTPDEIERVKKETGITEPMDFGWPRKNGVQGHYCPRHHKTI